MSKIERTATVTLDGRVVFFLREKYGKRKGVKRLIECAVMEAVAASAKEYLKTHGYAALEKEVSSGSEH